MIKYLYMKDVGNLALKIKESCLVAPFQTGLDLSPVFIVTSRSNLSEIPAGHLRAA